MESGLLLGHVVSKSRLEVELDKVKIILALTASTNVRKIRGFLGCVGYYRRFIKDYARKALPLTELLKKEEKFSWNPERQSAFKELKLTLSRAPILSPPDWAKEFHIILDASSWCLGDILWQFNGSNRESPVYYVSRQMSPAEKKYTTTERKALAVIYACKKFRHYLLEYQIIFHTDHDSLKYLVNKPDLSGRIARWILLLQEFNYEVMVKPGKANTNANYLSRQRGTKALEDIEVEFPYEFQNEPNRKEDQVLHITGEDESEFSDIIAYLVDRIYPTGLSREEKNIFQHKVAPYTIIQGILLRLGVDEQLKRCLEKKEWKQVMRALHFGPSGGHFAANTTANQISSVGYWWPYLIQDVKAYVGSCD